MEWKLVSSARSVTTHHETFWLSSWLACTTDAAVPNHTLAGMRNGPHTRAVHGRPVDLVSTADREEAGGDDGPPPSPGSRSCIESNEMRTCWGLATTLDVGKMRASWRLTRPSPCPLLLPHGGMASPRIDAWLGALVRPSNSHLKPFASHDWKMKCILHSALYVMRASTPPP